MILALDCATKTGWCLMENGRVHSSGVQDFAKVRGESNGAMFLRFRQWLTTLLARQRDVKLVVYEQAHFRGGAATEITVNLTGRVQEVCNLAGIEYVPVHTATLKKHATGKGLADKAEMMLQARSILRRLPVDDNEADAVLLARYAWEKYGI